MAIVRSETLLTVVTSFAESLDVFVCPPPDTDTLLVTLAAVVAATLTVRVMAG